MTTPTGDEEDVMATGAERYDVKARAGWSRTRADGSQYAVETDRGAYEAERWACAQLGGTGLRDDAVLTGDEGYDFVVTLGLVPVRVDVVWAGLHANGGARGLECHLIVNLDSPKLYRSEVLLLVAGQPGDDSWRLLGGIPTVRFLACAHLRDHGFGPKLSMPAADLWPVERLFRVRPAVQPTTTITYSDSEFDF